MESVKASLDEIGEDKKLSYFRHRIRDFNEDSSARSEVMEQFRRWLSGLDYEDITRSYQRLYYPTYLNLLSALGGRRDEKEISSLAVRNVKSKVWGESEFYHSLLRLSDVATEPDAGLGLASLRGCDVELIRSLLGRGRGLIVCTFRFGLVAYGLATEPALVFRASVGFEIRHTR